MKKAAWIIATLIFFMNCMVLYREEETTVRPKIDYKVKYLNSGIGESETDFICRVAELVSGMKDGGQDVFDIRIEEGRDMTGKMKIVFAVIYYRAKEKK